MPTPGALGSTPGLCLHSYAGAGQKYGRYAVGTYVDATIRPEVRLIGDCLMLHGWAFGTIGAELALAQDRVGANASPPAPVGAEPRLATYIITRPPSTARTWPVMKAASSLARNATALGDLLGRRRTARAACGR